MDDPARAPDGDVATAAIEDAEARLRLGETRQVADLLARLSEASLADPRMRARASSAAALLAWLDRRYPDALRAAGDAADLWRSIGCNGEAATARALGARALIVSGQSEDALAEAGSALDDARRAGDARAQMQATIALGHIHYRIQRFDEALVHFELALQIARSLADDTIEGGMLDSIACVQGSQAAMLQQGGDEHAARRLLGCAIERWELAAAIARRCGHRIQESSAIANHAEALVLLDRSDEALALLRTWPVDPVNDGPRTVWQHRDTEGLICLRLGRYGDAIERFREALASADGGSETMDACEHLSDAHERNGDAASALAYHKRFHALYKQVMSEAALRSASVAAIRLETVEAKAEAVEQRGRAERLEASNDQLARRADDLLQMSLEDPLTGLANRRMMDKLIAADSQGFAVAMIDADHFKRINDGWSHAVGDEVLRRLAELIRSCCRTSDTPVRCGGEEFAVLLRHSNEGGALVTAERIRNSVETFDWSSIGPGLAVTVSVGVASPHEAPTTAGVMALADGRLYEAKGGGRNRVVGRAPALGIVEAITLPL